MTQLDDELENTLEEHSELIAVQGWIIDKIKQKLSEEKSAKEHASFIQTQKEIQTFAYQQAQAYDNAIVIAGYAGYFALFSLTKEIVSDFWMIFSALCLGVSITAYVVWQVGSMLNRSRDIMRFTKLIYENSENYPAAAQALIERQKTIHFRIQFLWYLMLLIAVPTAAIGAGVLMFSFSCYLWRHL